MLLSTVLQAIANLIHKVMDKSEEQVCTEFDNAAARSDAKDWRNSITDTAKLLGLDGSYEGRERLWYDLGFTDRYTGSAGQNTELRKKLFQTVRERGIRLPSG